jgi:type II secretory pathway pseudopilin PulG
MLVALVMFGIGAVAATAAFAGEIALQARARRDARYAEALWRAGRAE